MRTHWPTGGCRAKTMKVFQLIFTLIIIKTLSVVELSAYAVICVSSVLDSNYRP